MTALIDTSCISDVNDKDIQRLAKFSCELCGKFLTCKSAYDRHMTSHTGIKAFVCPSCGQGFTRKENLRAHMFMKHQIKSNLP